MLLPLLLAHICLSNYKDTSLLRQHTINEWSRRYCIFPAKRVKRVQASDGFFFTVMTKWREGSVVLMSTSLKKKKKNRCNEDPWIFELLQRKTEFDLCKKKKCIFTFMSRVLRLLIKKQSVKPIIFYEGLYLVDAFLVRCSNFEFLLEGEETARYITPVKIKTFCFCAD